ncbi:glutamate--tRNA ligase family protein, partial [Tabrizicola sp.]|uniref:glutamate--tRNA ligase family protein n=1 Tax=Tabrizicola sp. TaxID=2005166 RepID=UPI00286AE6AC
RHLGCAPLSGDTLRLDVSTAFGGLTHLGFDETGCSIGHHLLDAETFRTEIGDFGIARRESETSYHLAVVVDDAAQQITHVVRGEDLFEATKIHILLQRLLGLPTPIYHHHRLIRDDQGKRLAKRDDARALAKYRAEGATPEDIRRMVRL